MFSEQQKDSMGDWRHVYKQAVDSWWAGIEESESGGRSVCLCSKWMKCESECEVWMWMGRSGRSRPLADCLPEVHSDTKSLYFCGSWIRNGRQGEGAQKKSVSHERRKKKPSTKKTKISNKNIHKRESISARLDSRVHVTGWKPNRQVIVSLLFSVVCAMSRLALLCRYGWDRGG